MLRLPNLPKLIELETIKRLNNKYAIIISGATSSLGTLYMIDIRVFLVAAISIVLFATTFFLYSVQQRSKGSDNTLSSLSRVTSVDTIKNLSKNLLSSLDCSNSLRSAIQSITRKECFARLDYIEQLPVSDISILFRYAADANLNDFEKRKFIAEQTQIVQAMITALDMAVKVSRGCLSEGTTIISTSERSVGSIDALRFVAVTRIFAEWRNLRLVPKGGYQRYAVGLSLAYRDMLQNLEKIERGVHEYLRHHQTLDKERKSPTSLIPSPTLRQLLQFELEIKLHKKLPYLTEKSSASGLLWTKRQLHYQLATLGNSLEVPEYYASPKDAASAAYRIVYNDYHGWAVKQIFSHSFSGSPPMVKIWLSINPPNNLSRINGGGGGEQNYATTTSTTKCPNARPDDNYPPLLTRKLSDAASCATSQISSSSSIESSVITEEDDNEFLAVMEKFGDEIVEKLEDLLRMFNCGKEEKKKRNDNLILSSESYFNLDQLNTDFVGGSSFHNSGNNMNDNISIMSSSTSTVPSIDNTGVASQRQLTLSNVIESSKRDVADFVRNLSPMVADIDDLINELNMSDPTKA
mmetsp:Transcript_28776/g.32237  ORF Transcript_28776/g.32237 Transcript_28776/m.32237 type:complete len:579 (+) Transcript_28776:44-1780(+)